MGYSFHFLAFDSSHAEWSGLKDVQWEGIFKLGASATAPKFHEQSQFEMGLYILYKYPS